MAQTYGKNQCFDDKMDWRSFSEAERATGRNKYSFLDQVHRLTKADPRPRRRVIEPVNSITKCEIELIL